MLTTYLWDELPEFVFNLLKLVPDLLPDDLDVDTFKMMLHAAINTKLPQLSDGKFGVFKGRNDTSEGSFYRINDGENDQCLYLSTIEYNGGTSLPQNWWPNVAPTPQATLLGDKGNYIDTVQFKIYRFFLDKVVPEKSVRRQV